ncbi:MAG: hypothetical protein AB1Z98_04840 [Nannocystaceae bacterium]
MKLPRVHRPSPSPRPRSPEARLVGSIHPAACEDYGCETFTRAQALGMDINEACACVVNSQTNASFCVSRQQVDQVQRLRAELRAAVQQGQVVTAQQLEQQLAPFANLQESHMVCARERPQALPVAQTITVGGM